MYEIKKITFFYLIILMCFFMSSCKKDEDKSPVRPNNLSENTKEDPIKQQNESTESEVKVPLHQDPEPQIPINSIPTPLLPPEPIIDTHGEIDKNTDLNKIDDEESIKKKNIYYNYILESGDTET